MARPLKLHPDSRAKAPSGQAPVHPEAGLRCWIERSRAERSVESLRTEGAKPQPATSSEVCRLVIFSARKAIGRAEHVTAKAQDQHPRTGGMLDLPGVGEAGCGEGQVRNRRAPARPSTSGKDRSHKATPKTSGVGREYFRTGMAHRQCGVMDDDIHQCILRWIWRRGGQGRTSRREDGPPTPLQGMGLFNLRGSARYPSPATSGRSSLSRVREVRPHGLKGRCCL